MRDFLEGWITTTICELKSMSRDNKLFHSKSNNSLFKNHEYSWKYIYSSKSYIYLLRGVAPKAIL